MKLFWDLNDSELLYLIREKNEVAYEMMFKKYNVFILKKVNEFRLKGDIKDEFVQEGLLLLQQAIYNYKEEYNKSFFTYFEFILKRRFYRLLKTENKYNERVIKKEEEFFCQASLNQIPVFFKNTSEIKFKKEIDKKIYQELILGNRQIKSFCLEYNLDVKKVYNKIFYLKKQHKLD